MVQGQVAARGESPGQAADDRLRLVVVQHVPQDPEHRDRYRLAEIQYPGGPGEDGVGITQVGVDIVGCPFGAAGQQGSRVREHQRVVVDVDDPGPCASRWAT